MVLTIANKIKLNPSRINQYITSLKKTYRAKIEKEIE